MKKYGQHFLTSKNVVEKIINSASLSKKDVVLEIGPGNGVLTKEIAKRAKKVYAVEIDLTLIEKLEELLLGNVEIINSDILKYGFPKDVTKIISNLPYQISSPVTEKILDFGKPAILMYQKEFGLRMLANPGEKNYSRISILVKHMAEVKELMRVSRINFSPPPRVDSIVLNVVPKRTKKDKKLLLVAQIIFPHKKKEVLPALMSERHYFKIKDKKELRKNLEGGIPVELAKKRVINLSIHEINEIKRTISKLLI